MDITSERRRLDPVVGELGVARIALLRLHALGEPDRASTCVDEIRRLLAAVDDCSSVERRTPMVDVTAGYGRWAQVYDDAGNPLIDCEQPTVWSWLDGFDGDPILDAACGTGRHLSYLAKRGHRVIGVDLVPDMLEVAHRKTPDADLRLGDLLMLPLDEGEVRGAVCSLALEHVSDLGRAYAELARVVASGGYIITSTMHPVLRSVFGWGAWFVDDHGKTDIPTFEYGFADHVNAAAASGLVLERCAEPIAPASALPADASITTRIAYSATPMVLVLQFLRP